MDLNLTEIDNIGSPFFQTTLPPDASLQALQSAMDPDWSPSLPSEEIHLEDIGASYSIGTDDLFDFGVPNCTYYFDDSTKTRSESLTETFKTDVVTNQIKSKRNYEICSGDSVTVKLKGVLMSRRQQRNLETTTDSIIKSNNSRYNEASSQYGCLHNPLRFPPCCVCDGNASGLHYGVNTCEPCKGFFTRYLRKKDTEEYVCSKSDNCAITNRLRGNCSACRLKKCLGLGMSRQNSRLGRYSLTRRMETIMKVKKLEERDALERANTRVEMPPVVNGTRVVTSAIDDSVTMIRHRNGFSVNVKSPNGFSEKLVKSLVDYMEKIKPYGDEIYSHEQIMNKLHTHFEAYQLKIKVFGHLKSIPKDEYFNLLKVHGIEIDHRMMYLKQSANEIGHVIERYCNFAKQIPNFSQLTTKDQSNLLKSSRYDFFMILMHEAYLHDKKVFLAHNGIAFHQEEVADKFFSRKLVLTVCDMYRRLQKLKLSSKETALLIAISLLFTDRCTLDNPHMVEQIQFCLVQLLRNQLEKTCKMSAFRRFIQIINCLTIMRDSSELYLKEYNMLCKDEHVIEEVPIMTEMLFDH